MSDQNPDTGAADANPVFQIQRLYLKDLSLEQPNSPQILGEAIQPEVDIALAVSAEPVVEGIFELRNIAADQMQLILGVACPTMVYPYLRAIVSDVCTRAGFPPVLLTEVNFQAMYEAQQQQMAAGQIN